MPASRLHVLEKPARVAMVTGATGAIGRAIAEGLAADHDTEVVLVCRDEKKAKRVNSEISRRTGNQRVRSEIVDLGRRSEIVELARRLQGPLHVLVNNAAATPRRREETPEHIERQLATNVLGYLWMVEELQAALERAAPAQVVNVASYWAGDLDLDDLEFRRRAYDNNTAYRQSKQCNRMLSVALAERLSGARIYVNACHPGDVNSALSNSLGFGGSDTPEQGAETPLWLINRRTAEPPSGKYFEHKREVRCRFGADRQAVERLYEECARYR